MERLALREDVGIFGDDILLPDGLLDRNKLSEIMFIDYEQWKKLNAIVHPRSSLGNDQESS